MSKQDPIPIEAAGPLVGGPSETGKGGPQKQEDEPIRLVEENGTGATAVRAFGASAAGVGKKAGFKRPLNLTGQGATRCRVFHSKVAVNSLENMEQSINEWLDSEKIEIKHVGHIIGVMEGKRPEPNLIVMVWY